MGRMRVWITILTVFVGLGSPVPRVLAQEENTEKQQKSAEKPVEKPAGPISLNTYRLDFLLSELEDGKKINSRNYSVVPRQGILNKLRVGARVPISTTGPGAISQVQYLDVGISIDCRIEERDGYVVLDAIVDSSSFALPQEQTGRSVGGQPVIQNMRSQVNTVLTPGKPTVISSMDDPSSKRRYQIEVTATKVK